MPELCAVACKLPQGLTVSHKGKTVTLKGATHSGNRFGFGITEDVDADWFADWMKTDAKDFPAVKNGSIFIMPDAARAEDAGKERRGDAEVQSGAEPLDPEKPSSDPRLGLKKDAIQPTEETVKALSEGGQPKDVK